jgi:hypothetical protein
MVGMVLDVRIGIVDCLEMYLVYGLGWWLDWKGARSMDWVCGYFLLKSIKDHFMEHVTIFTAQSTWLIWVGSVE